MLECLENTKAKSLTRGMSTIIALVSRIKEEKGQEFSMANFNEVLLGSKNTSQKDDTPER